ncbi:MAG: class I SAM-dependent DNA methyltransferase, partial [bacterium]
YRYWAHHLTRLFKKAEFPVKNVLDISCGTGSLLLNLTKFDLQVAGLDGSASMVKIACAKSRQKNLCLPIWCGSMVDFKVKYAFDAVVSTYDSMNYCLDLEACTAAIENAALALRTGGLFIFDLCTERNSRRYFQNHTDQEETDDFRYIRQSFYEYKKRIQVNEFFISLKSNSDRVFHETHEQRIYRIDEIMSIIPLDVYDIVGVYDGFSLRAGSEKSDRVYFVLRKVK